MTVSSPLLLATGLGVTALLLVLHRIRHRRTLLWKDWLEGSPEKSFWPRCPSSPSLPGRWGIRGLLLALAGGCLALALAGPEVEGVREGASRPGTPVVIVLDISRSMTVTDVPWGRLGSARLLIRRLGEAVGYRPLGLVVFAGEAYAALPPTLDRTLLHAYVEAARPEMLTRRGTSLAEGLREASAMIVLGPDVRPAPGEPAGHVLLFTDGEVHGADDDALAAAEELRNQAVVLHVVGLGTRRGGPLPALPGEAPALMNTPGPAENREESPRSRARPGFLRELAERGGGDFVEGGGGRGSGEIVRALEEEGVGTESGADGAATALWPLPGTLALLFLVLEMILGRTSPGRKEENG